MEVSVVIPAYNASQTIDSCLISLLDQDFSSYEVIVVDDGSSDDTVEKVKGYSVKLVEKSRGGAASARNTGAELSEGQIIVFLDSDCLVKKSFISRIAEPLRNQEIGMTQGYIDVANPDSLIASLIFVKARYAFKDLEYLDFAWSGGLAIKRDLFQRVGKFNETLKIGEEDALAYRVLGEGYKIYLAKEARFWHHFPESLWGHLKRQAATARWVVRLTMTTKRFTTQHGNLAEYFKLIIHGLTLFTLFLIPLSLIPFIILLVFSLLTHLRLACWAMKKGSRYILIIPFEFLTKLCWVAGSIAGLGDVFLKKT